MKREGAGGYFLSLRLSYSMSLYFFFRDDSNRYSYNAPLWGIEILQAEKTLSKHAIVQDLNVDE